MVLDEVVVEFIVDEAMHDNLVVTTPHEDEYLIVPSLLPSDDFLPHYFRLYLRGALEMTPLDRVRLRNGLGFRLNRDSSFFMVGSSLIGNEIT